MVHHWVWTGCFISLLLFKSSRRSSWNNSEKQFFMVALGEWIHKQHASPNGLFKYGSVRTKHKETQKHAKLVVKVTCLIFSKGNDVFVIAVDKFGESARLVFSHTDLLVLPLPSALVLLQWHQAPRQTRSLSDCACVKWVLGHLKHLSMIFQF